MIVIDLRFDVPALDAALKAFGGVGRDIRAEQIERQRVCGSALLGWSARSIRERAYFCDIGGIADAGFLHRLAGASARRRLMPVSPTTCEGFLRQHEAAGARQRMKRTVPGVQCSLPSRSWCEVGEMKKDSQVRVASVEAPSRRGESASPERRAATRRPPRGRRRRNSFDRR